VPYEVAIAPNEWSERGPNRQCLIQLTLTLRIFERVRRHCGGGYGEEFLFISNWAVSGSIISFPSGPGTLPRPKMGFEFERSDLEMTSDADTQLIVGEAKNCYSTMIHHQANTHDLQSVTDNCIFRCLKCAVNTSTLYPRSFGRNILF